MTNTKKEREMDRTETEKQIRALEAGAAMNDAYARAMERTAVNTDGRLGCFAAPNSYAAHIRCAAEKRARAEALRATIQG